MTVSREFCRGYFSNSKCDYSRVGVVLSLFLLIFFSIINGNEFSSGAKYLIIPIVLSFIYLIVFDRHKKNIFAKEYIFNILFCLSTILSVALSQVVEKSLFVIVGELIIWNGLYILFTSIKSYSGKEIQWVLFLYALTAVLLSVIIICNYLTKSVMVDSRASIRIFGNIKDQNFLSAFLCPAYLIILFFALNKKKFKLLYILGAFVIVPAIFFTGSRGGFLTVIVVSILFFINVIFGKGKIGTKIAFIVAAVFGVLVLLLLFSHSELYVRMLSGNNYSTNERLTIWKYAMRAFQNNPVFGSGYGASDYYALSGIGSVTHNTFIQLLGDQGIVGMGIFLALVFYLFARTKKSGKMFILCFAIASFLPLVFISAYETATFWIPLIIINILSKYSQNYDVASVFLDR